MVGELASILISVVNVNTHPVHDMTSDQQCKTTCAAVYPVKSSKSLNQKTLMSLVFHNCQVVASLFNHSLLLSSQDKETCSNMAHPPTSQDNLLSAFHSRASALPL